MNEYAKIADLNDEVQAELVDSILTERGIPHLLRTYHDSAFDGIFQTAWGHVEAPTEYRDEILAIMEDVKKQSSDSSP